MADAEQISLDQSQPEKPRPSSVGERVFDTVVYGPINVFGTLYLTAVIAYFLEYGKFGRAFFGGASRQVSKLGLEPDSAYKTVKTTTLMMGGNFMLIPVKIAEHYKVKISTAINRWFGDKTDPQAIAQAPKQTWGSLIKGRLIAWVIVFGSFKGASKFFGEQFDKFEHSCGKWLADWYKQPTHIQPLTGQEDAPTLIQKMKALGEQLKPFVAKKKAKTITDVEKATVRTIQGEMGELGTALKDLETRPYAFGKILALDIFATLMAAALLYVGSRFFATKSEEKKPEHVHPDKRDEVLAKAAEQPKTREQPNTPRAEILAATASSEQTLRQTAAHHLNA